MQSLCVVLCSCTLFLLHLNISLGLLHSTCSDSILYCFTFLQFDVLVFIYVDVYFFYIYILLVRFVAIVYRMSVSFMFSFVTHCPLCFSYFWCTKLECVVEFTLFALLCQLALIFSGSQKLNANAHTHIIFIVFLINLCLFLSTLVVLGKVTFAIVGVIKIVQFLPMFILYLNASHIFFIFSYFKHIAMFSFFLIFFTVAPYVT